MLIMIMICDLMSFCMSKVIFLYDFAYNEDEFEEKASVYRQL